MIAVGSGWILKDSKIKTESSDFADKPESSPVLSQEVELLLIR